MKMIPVSKPILFQLLVIFNAGYGHSLKEAFFQRQSAQYLPNSVITTKYTGSELECVTHCTRLKECLSVNYKIGGGDEGLCELNNNTISKRRGVDDVNFVYLGITTVWSLNNNPKIERKTSCKEIFDENATQVDGVYRLKAVRSSETYPVYCHMTEIPGCGPGGWTLVIKINGNEPTLNYDSHYWTNKKTYEVEDGLKGLTMKESKLASYWNTPFKKICLSMTVGGHRRWMALDYEASSLYSVIADGRYQSTNAGKTAWKYLITGSSLQPYCNKEGFGIFYKGEVEMRLGYLANNQNRCPQSDSCIGFGISYGACGKNINITCGNIAQCGSNDNGHKATAAFGYILVQ